jgi:membrane protein DedA with SNARE-associated domain
MIESLVSHYGYVAILIGTLLEGETILVLGGLAAHRGLLWLPGVMACGFVGSLASDQFFFFIGRRHGAEFLARRPRLQAGVARARGLVDRYNTLLILAFRFLYGLRNVTPLALGMSRVSTLRFMLLNLVGAAIWSVAIAALGWYVGIAAKQILGHLLRYELAAAAVIIAIGIGLWAWRRWVRDAPESSA